MQGPGSVRRWSRGCRVGGTLASICAVLTVPGAANAFVTAEVENGRLIARSDGGSDIIKTSCGADLRVKVNGLDPSQGPAPCSAIGATRIGAVPADGGGFFAVT